MKPVKVVTVDELDYVNSCKRGMRWFMKNYPEGLKPTTRNIRNLFAQLLKRKKSFGEYKNNMLTDSVTAMMFFIDACFVYNELGTEDYTAIELNALMDYIHESDSVDEKYLADEIVGIYQTLKRFKN